MKNAKILSIGAYAPENIIPNSYFDKLLGEDVSTWLEENVQIYERRWAAEDESTADLAQKAAEQALERSDLTAQDIDLIIIATDTPEYISPSTASVVQDRLKAYNSGTFDINTACAGFVTAIDVGAKYIQTDDQYENILVIGAYAMSKHLNKEDKKTVTLFADGAGAVILQATEEDKGFQSSKLVTKGEYHDWMGIYGGGTHKPVSDEVIKNHEHQLQFVKRFPSDLNPNIWTKLAEDLNEKLNVDAQDVDHYFITQININAIYETLNRLGVEREKGHTIMHHYGYTGSACIPMALNEVWEKDLINDGDLLYFIGSGGGLAFASAAFKM